MRSISLPLKMLLALSVFGGGALVACGEDEPADEDKNNGEEDVKGNKDAGKDKKDAGKDSGKGSKDEPEDETECQGTGFLSYADCECEDEEETGCVQRCTSGKPGGACLTPAQHAQNLASGFNDGGGIRFPDASFTVNPDAGAIKVSEAGLPTAPCPASFTCGKVGGGILDMFGGGALPPVCMMGNMPAACTASADCTSKGFGVATCVGLDDFAPGAGAAAPVLMLPAKFCAAPCTP